MEQVDAICNEIGAKPSLITITDYNKVIRAVITKRYLYVKL